MRKSCADGLMCWSRPGNALTLAGLTKWHGHLLVIFEVKRLKARTPISSLVWLANGLYKSTHLEESPMTSAELTRLLGNQCARYGEPATYDAIALIFEHSHPEIARLIGQAAEERRQFYRDRHIGSYGQRQAASPSPARPG